MEGYPKEYIQYIKIATYDIDKYKRMRFSAILRLQQEVGELHLNCCGMSYNFLAAEGLIFVLTSSRFKIARNPELGEEIKLKTWHKKNKRAQFYRCYQFIDSEENIIIDSMSSFVIINHETHKILRPSVFDKYDFPQYPDKDNSIPEDEKMLFPDNPDFLGGREIRFSDLDYNFHTNNTIYADFIYDYIPDVAVQLPAKEVWIRFIKETSQSDKLALYGKLADGRFYLKADNKDVTSCMASCIF